MLINKAIFPVAGLGTRFLPATKAQPKEMLPVVDKPLIQYAVEEAYAAGIREMIFVTGRSKRPIEDHFDLSYELEKELEAANKKELLDLVHQVKPDDMECVYVRQPKMMGLGHAVLCAERLVRNEPFAVLLADDLMVGNPPVMKQMVQQFEEWRASILAVQEVPADHTRRYGIVAGTSVNGRMMDVQRIVEKPAPEEAPSRLGVAGRYVLTPGVFREIRNQHELFVQPMLTRARLARYLHARQDGARQRSRNAGCCRSRNDRVARRLPRPCRGDRRLRAVRFTCASG